MSSVTFPTAIGGDGSTVSDDDNVTTGLRNGGWRTRFIPCFTNLVNIADYIVSYTAQTSTFAGPPPLGSTTPNTGAFTRVTVTGSTAPANGLYLPAANSIGFSTNSTERVRIDASGNLGIGTSSPVSILNINSTGNTNLTISAGSTGLSRLVFQGQVSNNRGFIDYDNTSSVRAMVFRTNENEAMRIDSSGNLLVAKTSSSETVVGASLLSDGRIISTLPGSTSETASYGLYSTGAGVYRFYVGMNGVINATSTSIAAISDISLKENIRPLETGLTEVLALQPRRFDWKNGDGVDVAGFIAQEVETVLPDLVIDYKYNDEETKRGLKMGDMIPTLVKAIQELSAELNELKQRIN